MHKTHYRKTVTATHAVPRCGVKRWHWMQEDPRFVTCNRCRRSLNLPPMLNR